jgi:hypothetical protein
MADVLYRVQVRGQPQLQPERVEAGVFYRFTVSGTRFALAIEDRFEVSDLRWGDTDHAHGSETTLHARVAGHDGGPLHFVVEHQHGGSWQHYATLPATVRDGEISATLRVHHPVLPPTGALPEAGHLEAASPAQLRFKVEKGSATG